MKRQRSGWTAAEGDVGLAGAGLGVGQQCPGSPEGKPPPRAPSTAQPAQRGDGPAGLSPGAASAWALLGPAGGEGWEGPSAHPEEGNKAGGKAGKHVLESGGGIWA